MEVVAGQQELEAENGQRRTIQRMIPHESYDETTGLNDLAVLEVVTKIKLESFAYANMRRQTEVAFIYDGTSVNQVACGELDTTVPKATTMGWGEQSVSYKSVLIVIHQSTTQSIVIRTDWGTHHLWQAQC